MEFITLIIEILHLALFKGWFFKFLIGAIGLGKLVPGDHVTHFATIEGLPLTRFRKFKMGDDIWLAIKLDLQPFTQIRSSKHNFSPSNPGLPEDIVFENKNIDFPENLLLYP
jgi:hypothetical protein